MATKPPSKPDDDEDPVVVPMISPVDAIRSVLSFVVGGLVGLLTFFALASDGASLKLAIVLGLAFGAGAFVLIRPPKRRADDRFYNRFPDE